MENSGTSGSDGVLALVPSSMVEPFTTYIMECEIVEQSPGITGFGINAQSNTLDPYRTSKEVSGGGHHAIIFTTGATVGSWVALRITARPATAGLYFVVDNFTLKKYTVVNQPLEHTTDFSTAVMNGVNVNDKGLIWKPFTPTITSLSVAGTSDKKIQVNCTNVNDSRIASEFNNFIGGNKYLVKFTLGQGEVDKRVFIHLASRTGSGAWTSFQLGIFYTGSGNFQYNFIMPAGADQLKVEFLRQNTGSAIDGLTVPYTIDNFSLTRLEPIASQTTIVCDPQADPSGENGIYRYGFNGKENDNEVKGEGNQQDYGMRVYDPRLGKFLSVDPLSPDFPWYTPYQFAGNKPIWAIDLDGLEEVNFQSAKFGKKEYEKDIPWYYQPEVFKQNAAISTINSLIQTGEDLSNLAVSSKGRDRVLIGYGLGVWGLKNSYDNLLSNVASGNFRQIGSDLRQFASDPNNVEDLVGNFSAGLLLSKLPVKAGLSAALNKVKSSSIFRNTPITTTYNGLKRTPRSAS